MRFGCGSLPFHHVETTQTTAPARTRLLASKVPEVTLLFWVAKLLTTGMGEACSDWLFLKLGIPGLLVGIVVFGIAMVGQLRARRYVPAIYWFAVSMVAVVGTMVADVIHVAGVSYAVTTPFFAVALAAVFRLWYRVEGTLSIHSITTARRELFYWLAVITTFALGTAAGDLTAATMRLGYLNSGWLFLAAFLVPALAYWKLRLHPVAAFWAAYVLTRPLGASFADWLGKPASRTGLDFGDGTVTVVATILIVLVVAALTRQENEVVTAPAD